MADEYGPTFITVTDEDGREIVLEFVDALEYNGQQYQAFFPAETEGEDEDPDNGLVILKVLHEDGEDLLSTLDSDEELDAVYDLFMESLFDEDGESCHSIQKFLSGSAGFLLHPGPGCDTVNMCPAGFVIGLFLTHISLYGMPDQRVVRRPPSCCLRLEVGSGKARWRQPTWP